MNSKNPRVLKILIVALALVAGTNWAGAELSNESRDLLTKLAEFEKAEREKAEALIEQKRAAVADLLGKQLETETRNGNLEAALDLKSVLESLKQGEPASKFAARAIADPEIPRDALRHRGSRFKVFLVDEPITWDEARAKCQALGGDLAWLDSPKDEELIVSIMKGVVAEKGHAPIWMGGRKSESGEWVWLNGDEIDEDFWAKPDDALSAPEANVLIRWIGSFNTAPPDTKRVVGYLCRWK